MNRIEAADAKKIAAVSALAEEKGTGNGREIRAALRTNGKCYRELRAAILRAGGRLEMLDPIKLVLPPPAPIKRDGI